MKVETEIEIEATPAAVWAVLIDTASWPEWNKMIPRLKGTLAPGEVVKFKLKAGAVALPIDAEVITVEENTELAWIGPARKWVRRAARGTHYFRIEDLGDDRVRFTHGEDFEGPLFSRLPTPAKMVRVYESFNRQLKRRVESL